MKFFNFFKNLINKKKPAGAMIVLMLVFFVVFILAFGSGYLVFINTSKSVDVSNNLKARYAALAGKDKALYEAMKNNYDFAGNCASNMFQKTLNDGSSYTINCVNNGGEKTFYAVGEYKNVDVSLEIDCINIEEDCLASCQNGSICGGGKLLKTATSSLSISPSGCDVSGANCSNTFSTADTVNFQWDTTVPDTFVCGNTLNDSRDSQQYSTVQIGTQCWFAENLAYLPSVQTNTDFVSYGNAAIPAYGVYGYTGTDVAAAKATANYQTYGVLYNWYGAVATSSTTGTEGLQGACPTGWHIPTSAEFATLSTYLGGDYAAGGKLKQIGETTWLYSGMGGATNSSGFTALAAGYRYYIDGTFTDMSYSTSFLSSLPPNSLAESRKLSYDNTKFIVDFDSTIGGFSVRCIKDSSSGGTITYKGASNVDNGKTNITTLVPQTNTYLEAAKYCDDLVVNGYSDWYLPATNELAALRSNSAFSYFNLQAVSGDDYWVSTEQGSTTPTMAGYIKMSTGASSYADKASEFKLRCVRRNVFNPCSSGTVCGTNCTYQDREYKTVQIGTQCWFKENLNYDNGCSTKTWTNSTDTGWCGCYTPNDSTCANYGRLYQWSAAMNATTTEGAQGICPSGWHVPSRANFTTLKTYLNSSATYKCSGTTNYVGKSLAATSTWATYATACTVGNTPTTNNASGFNLFSSGYKNPTAAFTTAGYSVAMWSSTQSGASAYDLGLYYTNQTFLEALDSKPYAFSVRCIKN